MPTYDYKCQECGSRFERFQSMTDKPLKKCPECKKSTLVRLIGAGAGIIFKGSGFYETDYKRRNGKSPAKEDSPAPCPQTACPSAKECPASKVNTDT